MSSQETQSMRGKQQLGPQLHVEHGDFSLKALFLILVFESPDL